MSLIPIRLGAPLVFEDTFTFDKPAVIARCEELANNTPGFNSTTQNIEIGDAGTTALGQYGNSSNDIQLQQGQPHTWPELSKFMTWVGQNASQILKTWEFDFDRIAVTNSWVNRHRKGGWTNWHIHHHAHLSIAAYFQADEKSGHLILEDPLEPIWEGYPAFRKTHMNGGYRLPVEDNKVYFFAPFFRHSTEASQSDKDRWVLSLNLQTFKDIK
jgi:hypothetical protein